MTSTSTRTDVGRKSTRDKESANNVGAAGPIRPLKNKLTIKGTSLGFHIFAEGARNLYRMPDVEFIDNFRSGIEPEYVNWIAAHMGTSQKNLQDYLQLSSTTLERKKNKLVNLDIYQSERLAGLKRLIDQVQAMVEDSGDPTDFDAAEWLGRWIEMPLPALGGKKPADYLSTVSGQKLLSNLLNQMQSGAYA